MSMKRNPDGSVSVGILTDMEEPEIYTPKKAEKPVVEEVKESVETEAPKKRGRKKN